jgi:uroporphyrinogen-III synthase
MGSSKLTSKLSDLRVLVTRPLHQHASLCSAIEDNGGEAKHFPLFAIEPVNEPILVQQIKTKVENLDNYQLIIFISTNAVKFGALWINDYWQRFPVGVGVLAMGPSTARKVSIELDCGVVTSDAGASSEDILLLDELADISGSKVAIVRGIGGRELLAESLRQRGAEVDYIEVYRRMPTQKSGEELATVLRQENINIFVVTSGESLARLDRLIKDTVQLAHTIRSIPIIVPSNRVAKDAAQLGYTKVKLALGADDEAIINALQEIAN